MRPMHLPLHISRLITTLVALVTANASIAGNFSAQPQPASSSHNLMDLSIEELMNIEVTTASRQAQKLSQTSSAVFVITQEDIRRSGATSIPDALRMAPGVEVSRINADKWSISIRGFNGRFANKLQVLMDGRSVYNPLFAGILWDQQDTLMEDIERIEIIRGPGAAMWGVNAVNGVINIITKKAADTQGTLLSAGGGSFEQGFISARHGGKINDDTPFRLYAKAFTRDSFRTTTDGNANDAWHSAKGGFRLDHARGIDQFTLQGDFYYNAHGDRLDKTLLASPIIQVGNARGDSKGGNLRLRWDRKLSEKSSIMLQSYYDISDYRILTWANVLTESFDIDFQHRFPLFERHDITWGANYRLYHNKINDTETIAFNPRGQINHLGGIYVRDEITLIPDQLLFTIGSRFDHNDFSGWEIQPNARLMWMPDAKNSVWAAVSRAVRTPSRAEHDIRLNTQITNALPGLVNPLPFPVLSQVQGTPSFNAEKLLAYELGYRHQFTFQASIDIAAFFNDYSQLRDLSAGVPIFQNNFPQHLILPVALTNQASGYTYGVEISADSRPLETWRLQLSYSYLNMHIRSTSPLSTLDSTSGSAARANPHHHISLRSLHDFSERLQFNFWLRYVSSVDFYNIPGYITMDSKLSFRPVRNVELYLVGQNLFQNSHQESVSDFIPLVPAYVPRGIYAGAEWRF